jgi:hypothetical protein
MTDNTYHAGREINPDEPLHAEFSETGGYQGMYGAWRISQGDRILFCIDQRLFDQLEYDYDFRSEPAARFVKRLVEGWNAGIVFEGDAEGTR